MKNTLKAILLAILVLCLGVATLLWRMSSIGASGLEAWIGVQLQKAVNARGEIVLHFSSIDYQAPNRVVLENLRLSRPVPEGPDLDLVTVARAQIDLGSLPRRGEPIVISAVELSRPTVHVDALLKPDPTPDEPDATSGPAQPKERPQLSAILELEKVTITDGTIQYDDGSGQPPMSWTNLDVALNIVESDSHWHDAHITLDQSPLLKLDVKGEVNLDDLAVRSLAMALDVDLNDPKSMQFFAPRVQEMVRKFEVQGRASVRATGAASLTDPTAADLDATVNLTGGHVTVGSYHLPLEQLQLAAHVRDRVATLQSCDLTMIGGKVRADGTVELSGGRQVNVQVLATQLDLHKLLRDQSNPELAKRKLAGQMNAHVVFRPTVDWVKLFNQPEGSGIVWASGYARVYNGRLVNLPVIGQIISMTRRVTNTLTQGELYRDEFETQFLVVGKRMDFSDLLYFGDVVAARGKGTIAFNGDLNLVVNAGPLEGIQQYLGAVGRAWGNVTDRLLAYRVRGTVKQPIIRPMFGGG